MESCEMLLKDKIIVITGGTSGIGYELAKTLQRDNKVVVISRSDEKLDAISAEFEDIVAYKSDLSNLDDVKSVATLINKSFTKIDLLINNAAVQNTPTFTDNNFEYESINKEITLNFTSVCCLTYLLLPSLQHDSPSIILNINSGLALAPKTSSAIYSATKSALDSFSQALSSQLKDTNIKVQQAFLDIVETSMTEGRGNNNMSAQEAAVQIIHGVENNKTSNDIGRVKILRFMLRLAPVVAKKIMLKN